MADSYSSSEASHRALRAIRRALERHPVVTAVQGFPDGNFTEIRADLAVERWGIEHGSATLTVHWLAGETPDACPEFEFHYSDGETDFGWHHHEQEHVDGRGHFQERTGNAGYTYESHTFQARNPAQLSWEIMSTLSSKLSSE